MAAVGHERRIRANAPAAGRPQTADPAGSHGGFRLGPCMEANFFRDRAADGAGLAAVAKDERARAMLIRAWVRLAESLEKTLEPQVKWNTYGRTVWHGASSPDAF
jgi:hypothetical protein